MIDVKKMYGDTYQVADVQGKPAIVCQWGHIHAAGTQLIAVLPFRGGDPDSLLRRAQLLGCGLAVNDGNGGLQMVQVEPTTPAFAKLASVLQPLPRIEQNQIA